MSPSPGQGSIISELSDDDADYLSVEEQVYKP